MIHKAWSRIEEVPYCFSRSYVKLQGHTAIKIVEFDPNWAFPDCNSSLNSPMAMKCCTKLGTAKERCPIVFQGHPSNFKVTRYKTSPILTQIGRFRTIGRSQLSNPSYILFSYISLKFVHNTHCSCLIIFNFCTDHSSDTAINPPVTSGFPGKTLVMQIADGFFVMSLHKLLNTFSVWEMRHLDIYVMKPENWDASVFMDAVSPQKVK